MTIQLTFNNSIYTCDGDSDCPSVSVCFHDNYDTDHDSIGHCSCNVEFGSSGELCNQVSSMSRARLSIFYADLILAFFILLFTLYHVITYLKYRHFKVVDVRFTSLIFCFSAVVLFIMYISVSVAWVLHPNYPVALDLVKRKKQLSYYVLRNLGFSGFIVFLVAASLNVSLMWLEVAIASKRFVKIGSAQVSKNYRNAIIVFDFLVAISMGVTNWFNSVLAPVVAITYLMFVSLIYGYCAHSISRVLEESKRKFSTMGQKGNGYEIAQTLRLVKRSAHRFVIFTTIANACALVGAVQIHSLYRKAWEKGAIVDYILVMDVGVFFSLCSLGSLIRYVHIVSNKAKSMQQSSIQGSFHITPKKLETGSEY